MVPIYDEKKEKMYILHKISRHFPPHLHETPEFIYITDGTLELGIEQEFFHMEKGDFAIVFPNTIHHYQVFSSGTNSALYIYPPSPQTGQFRADLQKYSPKTPVIQKRNVPSDILNAIQCLSDEKDANPLIEQAYIQIILARSMPLFELEERRVDNGDVIYQTVSYIAGHFKEDLSLDKLAKALGISKFALSRIFSSTFHKNFNQYLNEQRLNYVCYLLEYSEHSITDICLDAGFQSQRTFNRAFQEVYRITPREYRNRYKERYLIKKQKESDKN